MQLILLPCIYTMNRRAEWEGDIQFYCNVLYSLLKDHALQLSCQLYSPLLVEVYLRLKERCGSVDMILPAVNFGSLCGEDVKRTGQSREAKFVQTHTKSIPNLYRRFQQD